MVVLADSMHEIGIVPHASLHGSYPHPQYFIGRARGLLDSTMAPFFPSFRSTPERRQPPSDSDPFDDSTTPGCFPKEPPEELGLCDASYSSTRREMLDLVNRLHSTGIQGDMDVPVIAVIGSQSSGKSSLIESISAGITLPRALGTCTRCPTECRLSSSDSRWQCVVTLVFTTDKNGSPLGQPRSVEFGPIIFDKAEVEDRVRRAQCAILNPSIPSHKFIADSDEYSSAREVGFSANYISLQISGKGVADLSFVDLPGIIASGPDKEMIENLVISYIKKPSCIILLTVACETDWENQRGFDVAKKYDPKGVRTTGVLTKPDRIPRGEEERWIDFVKNEENPLENGWFAVKQPDSKAIHDGITWKGSRTEEHKFFASTSPWSSLDHSTQQRLGTSNLTKQLSSVLSSLIAKRLPEIQDELQKLLQKTEDAIQQLPKPPSDDAFAEILRLLSDFIRDVDVCIEGTPKSDGLLQSIRPHELTFKRAIRSTAPNFKPVKRDVADEGTPRYEYEGDGGSDDEDSEDGEDDEDSEDGEDDEDASFAFLGNEEESTAIGLRDKEPIYIDQVMQRVNQAVTRELPDHYPPVIVNEYVTSIVSGWGAPTKALFNVIERAVVTHMKGLIAKHFGKFAQGGLQQRVTAIVTDYIKQRGTATRGRIDWLLQLESRPRTLNGHYYSDYYDKFLAHYKGERQLEQNGALSLNLQAYLAPAVQKVPTFDQHVAAALYNLDAIGIATKAADLPKLLPPDPYEQALRIMASVRAYFQVAYKRFVDNVPMAIDHELVLGLNHGRALEAALHKGLGIVGSNGLKRCQEFLQEPPQVVSRREELLKRYERLESAKKELMDFCI